MQAVQKDKSLSSLPSLKQMAGMYAGEGQDDTSVHALQKLANGLRAKFSVTDKLSIDDMTKLFQQPPTEEVLLYENNNFNYQLDNMYSFTLNGDSRFLHPYKLKFKFHTVSSRRANGTLYLYTNPDLNPNSKDFPISSDGDQDHEIVFDIPKGTIYADYLDSYMIYTYGNATITTMAIYAILPKEN